MSKRYLISSTLAFVVLVSPRFIRADILIPSGTDYLVTAPGTFTTIPGIGVVSLIGNPSACGSPCMFGSDTVVSRGTETPSPPPSGNQPDMPGQIEGSISAHLTQLWLKSVAPVLIGGFHYNVSVNLDPGQTETGELDLMNTNGEGTSSLPEGTFAVTSFFDVFVDLNFTPLDGGPAIPQMTESILLNSLSGSWNDPDDGTNTFLAGRVQECNAGSTTCHVADPVVPEPGSIMLLMTLIAACALALRKKHRTA